jgi:cytochrome P450
MSSAIVRPPGPGASAFRGDRRGFLDNPATFLLELQRQYGDIVFFRLGLRDNYLLSDPEDIKDVLTTHHHRFHKGPAMADGRLIGQNLFTIEEETHRRHRRLIQPAFHWERLKVYAQIMVDEATQTTQAFVEGEPRDIAVDMAHLTLGVAVRALFGTDMSEDIRHRVTEFVRTLLDPWFNKTGVRQATFQSEEYQRALEEAGSIVDELIRERREDPGERVDLLTMLLEAQDEEGGGGLSDREVRDEVTALIAAGHETTSNALTWAWYLLSQNPDAEGQMHAEIDAVLGERPPTVDDLEALPYVEMVFAESLRMLPSVWGFDRLVVEDHEVGGYPVPAGSVIFLSQYVVHHDPRWYPDPERFDPGRWTPEARKSRPRYAYFPFGGGLRMCIGQPFALMEASLVLATIAQRWRLRLEPDFPVELEGRITLRPKHGMRMIPERRS